MDLCVFCVFVRIFLWVHVSFLCLTPSRWFPVWSTSWQTPACHIYCPAGLFHPDLRQQSHQEKPSENQRLTVKNNLTLTVWLTEQYISMCARLCTSIVWSISCAAMVDATATAMADDTANCPAPPRGSALRSSGNDRKSGGAIGRTHSTGKAPERLNTAPNFQPDTHRAEGLQQSYKSTHTWVLCALKQPSPLL